MDDTYFMKQAIDLSRKAVEHGNEPFGAVLVKDGKAVYTNENQIYTKHDATFHAEAGLIRRFNEETGITDLSDYTLYSSCEPCFMCSGAIVWTKLDDSFTGLTILILRTFWETLAAIAAELSLRTHFTVLR